MNISQGCMSAAAIVSKITFNPQISPPTQSESIYEIEAFTFDSRRKVFEAFSLYLLNIDDNKLL